MRRPAAVLVAVVAAGILAGCGGDSWEQKCTAGDARHIACAPDERPPPSTLQGELLDGGSYDIASARGSVVVVNVWGSWCAPCRAEAADLEKTYQATKAQGVTFIGINHQDGRDAAKAFERGRITYPSVFDPDSRAASSFQVTPNFTPSTLILDRQGRIAVVIRRAVTQAELQPLVEQIATEAGKT